MEERVEDRVWAWWLCGVVGVAAALKGFGLPGDWALTQAQLDYSQGFVKRGLLGEVYGWLGLRLRVGLSVASFLELGVLLGLLGVWAWRSGMVGRCGRGVIAVAAGSYAVTFLFHMVGYADIVGAALVVAWVMIRDVRVRFWLGIPVVVAGLLVHEGFLLLFLPVGLVSFWLDGLRDRRAWWFGAVLAGIAVGVTVGIALRPAMTPEKVDALAQEAWDRVDFPLREDFYQVLTIGFKGTLAAMRRDGWERYFWWTNQAVGVFVYGPAVGVLGWFCRRVMRAGGAGAWTRGVVFCAVAAPMGMQLLGLDGMRWDCWVVVDAFVALGLVCRQWPEVRLKVSAGEWNGMMLAVALGMASGWGLFGGLQVNPYPFFPKAMQGVIARHEGRLPGF